MRFPHLEDTTKMTKWQKFWYFNGEIIGYVILIIVLIGLHIGISTLTYGDPMCAFKRCIVVKEIEEKGE